MNFSHIIHMVSTKYVLHKLIFLINKITINHNILQNKVVLQIQVAFENNTEPYQFLQNRKKL